MHYLFRLATVGFFIFALNGCGEGAPIKGRMLGVSFRENNPFIVQLKESLKKAVETHGDHLTAIDAQYESKKQLKDISDLIEQNAAAIFINPVNLEEIKSGLLKAREKGIPCIIVDAPAGESELVLCAVSSDNAEAGRLAAQALLSVAPASQWVIIDRPNDKACAERVAGFKEALEKFPTSKVLAERHGDGTTVGGRAAMQDLAARFTDLNAVFAVDEASALGAIAALEALGKLTTIKVVSADGSVDAAEAIKAKKLFAAATKAPREIGRIAAEQVYNYFDMRGGEKEIRVKGELIK